MPRCPRGPGSPARPRPALEVAHIFRTHGAAYRRAHALSRPQRAVLHAVETCRTPARGGHLDVCDHCGHSRPAYNSCRNRHGPKCEALREARWLDARLAQLLPTPYFHVVCTLPAERRPLVLRNRKRLFALLLRTAGRTLLTLGLDPARLGARVGGTLVLPTWTRDLPFPPHVHCVVTGGGRTPDGTRWVRSPRRHLLPVRVLGRLFRGKFLAGLAREHTAGHLAFGDDTQGLADPRAFARFRRQLPRQDWVVYAKRPFAGPRQVFRSLGRYTHRVGLTNHRLLAVDATAVRFATKHGRSVRLAPNEFIRRFLLPILPHGFAKIRHVGLFAPGRAGVARRARARQRLRGPAPPPASTAREDWRTLLTRLTGRDPRRCRRCQRGTLVRHPLPPGVPSRGPPPP